MTFTQRQEAYCDALVMESVSIIGPDTTNDFVDVNRYHPDMTNEEYVDGMERELDNTRDKYWFAEQQIKKLESDCMTIALRLYGEIPDSFAPETREVMDRWSVKVTALLTGEAA